MSDMPEWTFGPMIGETEQQREASVLTDWARRMERNQWIKWLVTTDYGFGWRHDDPPPITLEELAGAYADAKRDETAADYLTALETESERP